MSAHLLDDVARIIAAPVPRRQAIKLIFGGLAAAVAAHFGARNSPTQTRCNPPCKGTELCINGRCCPASRGCVNNTTCCPSGQVCLNNKSCCPSNQVCGNKCCPPGHVCSNNVCCPPGRVCSGACCPEGYECVKGKGNKRSCQPINPSRSSF